MHLSYDDILEYKRLYYKHFGQKLTDDDAWEQAHNLIYFFNLISDPVPVTGNSIPLDKPASVLE